MAVKPNTMMEVLVPLAVSLPGVITFPVSHETRFTEEGGGETGR